jgi:hypothetical protein
VIFSFTREDKEIGELIESIFTEKYLKPVQISFENPQKDINILENIIQNIPQEIKTKVRENYIKELVGRQQTTKQIQQPQERFPYEEALVPHGNEDYTHFEINVTGLEFPITKSDLVETSRNNFDVEDFKILYDISQKLPDKLYKNIEELENDTLNVLNNSFKIPNKKIFHCLIINGKPRDRGYKSQEEFLEDQRMNRKTLGTQKQSNLTEQEQEHDKALRVRRKNKVNN